MRSSASTIFSGSEHRLHFAAEFFDGRAELFLQIFTICSSLYP